MIPVLLAMKCNYKKCKLPDHRHQIDTLYSQICCSLTQSSIESIPSSKVHDCHDYIIPGFNESAKELYSAARDAYVAWRDAGRPRSGSLCIDMRRSRLRFRYTLRHCRQNEQSIRVDMHAKAYLEKDMVSFRKGMKKKISLDYRYLPKLIIVLERRRFQYVANTLSSGESRGDSGA